MNGQGVGSQEGSIIEVNPYAAPAEDEKLPARRESSDTQEDFYVVSLTKFYLLAVTTLGFYQFYWFFVQFRRQRNLGMKTKPGLAAIFSVFTAHRLFKRVDRAANLAGLATAQRATSQTAPYILLTIIPQLLLRLFEHSKPLSFLGFVLSAANALPLARVQSLANRVCGDPSGDGNAQLSAANIACIVVGGMFWLVAFVSLILQ